MEFQLAHSLSLLSRTPAALSALLHDLPGSWTLQNEGPSTWNAFEIVGHLIHGDRTDWIPRAKWILQHGENKPFEPFDRSGHRNDSQGKSLAQLLDEFAKVRSESLSALRALNLQPSDLIRRGVHPVFGPVTMSQLLATWTTHDLNHLHQLSRVMAHQYREAVGPWSAYLGVLHCTAHGA